MPRYRYNNEDDNGLRDAMSLYQLFSNQQTQQQAQEEDMLKLMMSVQQFQQTRQAADAEQQAAAAYREKSLQQAEQEAKALQDYRNRTIAQFDPQSYLTLLQSPVGGHEAALAYQRERAPETLAPMVTKLWEEAKAQDALGVDVKPETLAMWKAATGGEFKTEWLGGNAPVTPGIPNIPDPQVPKVQSDGEWLLRTLFPNSPMWPDTNARTLKKAQPTEITIPQPFQY